MPEPVETRAAYGQTLRRYESKMYGQTWTCDCAEFKANYERCWHIRATTINPQFWPLAVREAVRKHAED